MSTGRREAVRLALRLAALGLAAVLVLEALQRTAAPRIEAAQRERERETLSLALAGLSFDNPLEQDRIAVRAPRWLGSAAPLSVHRARRSDQHAAWVIEAVAPDGYGGPIHMLIGIEASGRLLGVRLTDHRETPGLGDYVDARRSDWHAHLVGLALPDLPAERWRITRDGGDIPYVAGATLSPRAVVAAVHRAAQLVEQHGETMSSAPTGSTLEFSDGPQAIARPAR